MWAYRAQDDFIAAPVWNQTTVYASGLGAFNTARFYALAADPLAKERVLWSKQAPYLKLPVVCAPAVVGGKLYFGDGMHQTHGGAIHCLLADSGRMVWQYPVPGQLVHLEGTPTVVGDRLYMGGGDAGVLCLDTSRLVLDGKELDAAAVAATLDQRWQALVARYEAQKKADPALAIPPDDAALPKPAPKKAWQQGQHQWHVDSPVAVVGERVLVNSAYLDQEKLGKRATLCLRTTDGGPLWEAPLKYNPWADACVSGDTVIVGCSSIRFDPKDVPTARGEVVALDLATGAVRWRKEIPGGILCAPAAQDDVVVFCATDGKVRAWTVKAGDQKWSYDAKAPFFAGPALAGGVVYAADTRGVLHAIALADGKPQWTFNVPGDPILRTQGMVYESPIVQGGRVYLGLSDLEGGGTKITALVCVGDQADVPRAFTGQITVDPAARTITIPAKVAPRKLPELKDVYPLEVVATWPAPRGQKAHETVVTYDVRPSELHQALEKLGLKPGVQATPEAPPSGPEVRLYIDLPGVPGMPALPANAGAARTTAGLRRVPIERLMVDARTRRPLPPLKWCFTGSVRKQPDPDQPATVYGADLSGTLITIYPVTDETVIQGNLSMEDSRLLKLETNRTLLPPEGTAVQLVIEVVK